MKIKEINDLFLKKHIFFKTIIRFRFFTAIMISNFLFYYTFLEIDSNFKQYAPSPLLYAIQNIFVFSLIFLYIILIKKITPWFFSLLRSTPIPQEKIEDLFNFYFSKLNSFKTKSIALFAAIGIFVIQSFLWFKFEERVDSKFVIFFRFWDYFTTIPLSIIVVFGLLIFVYLVETLHYMSKTVNLKNLNIVHFDNSFGFRSFTGLFLKLVFMSSFMSIVAVIFWSEQYKVGATSQANYYFLVTAFSLLPFIIFILGFLVPIFPIRNLIVKTKKQFLTELIEKKNSILIELFEEGSDITETVSVKYNLINSFINDIKNVNSWTLDTNRIVKIAVSVISPLFSFLFSTIFENFGLAN